MKYLQNTPHLDPLPSSDEGRGNPAVPVKRNPVCVCERSARFPLPFGRGEDQGEGGVGGKEIVWLDLTEKNVGKDETMNLCPLP